MQGKGKMVALATTRQMRQFTGEPTIWDLNLDRYEAGRDARALYRSMVQNCAAVKAVYELPMPLPMMKKRVRLLFEMNRHVKDPLVLKSLVSEARNEMNMALAQIFTTPAYLTSRWFGRHIDHTVLLHSVTAFRSREINLGRKRLREKARAIAQGESDIPGLPGPTYDEDGNRTGYYHPKGALPPGESELFARPPERKDWGSFSLPDPWNPKNSPDGPPDPHLCKNVEHVHRINLARKGPYTRHRTRRLIEHEAKVRDMSEYEYLMYFGENEVHLAANAFEMPEYDWAEERMDRRIRRVQHENQEIFRPARQAWLEQYQAQWKGVNYQPAIDYWLQVFQQWVPNYSTRVVECVDTIDAEWDAFISVPAHYAAYRSSAFAATISNADATPLARTMLDFVSAAQPSQPNTSQRPYDHPSLYVTPPPPTPPPPTSICGSTPPPVHSTNKWYTDNGLESLLILQEDVEAGIGCPRKGERVLQAEMNKLKDEIGCVVCFSSIRRAGFAVDKRCTPHTLPHRS